MAENKDQADLEKDLVEDQNFDEDVEKPESGETGPDLSVEGDEDSDSEEKKSKKDSEDSESESEDESKEDAEKEGQDTSEEESTGKLSKLKALLKKKKKKKERTYEVSLLISGLWSSDKETRWMTLFFLVSFVGACVALVKAFEQYKAANKSEDISNKMEAALIEFKARIDNERKYEQYQSRTLILGRMILELQELPEGTQKARGVVNMAEVEIVLLCDSLPTRIYLQQNMIEVKDQLSSVLTAIDRDEILSPEGKKKWKAVILRRLNSWLPEGQVEDLYFARLIVN